MPPAYPRVPHLPPATGASRDDLVLSEDDVEVLLSVPVVVEEKLDGANVMLWRDAGRVEAATRGGPGGRDRAGQLGPLRAWIAERIERLRPLLAHERVLYAEWLWLRHSVGYDALPEHLIGLDLLLSPAAGFASAPQGDEALSEAGIALPPRLFTGVLRTRRRLDDMIGTSHVGQGAAEGVIVRRVAGEGHAPRLAKVVAPHLSLRSDDSWRNLRERNALSPAARKA